MRKHDLWELMTKQGTPTMYYKGVAYILCGINREDGSGSRFNLTVKDMNTNAVITVYIQTID